MGMLPVPHEGKRPFFLKIDNRLEEVMLESLTEVIPFSQGFNNYKVGCYHWEGIRFDKLEGIGMQGIIYHGYN